MGQYAEDEIHKEMFGCYPWEEESMEGIDSTIILGNVKDSDLYLDKVGIRNKKRVYRAFEELVLKKPCGKTRKAFKMIQICNDHFDLFKIFVDGNYDIFVNNNKLKNLIIPIKEIL